MIGWFPDPYPDELFYSVCARYSERMNYKKNMHVCEDLFGESFSSVYLYLVTRLDYLITSLPAENNYTADRLIDEHTLLSFYSAFHPPYLIKMLRDTMKQNNPKFSLTKFGIFMQHRNYLRFCPQCILEDKKQFGECYWHRIHQVPGVEICLIHSIILQKSEVGSGHHSRGLVLAEEAVKTKINNSLKLSNVNFKHFIQLAHNIDWLLKHQDVIFFGDSIRKIYIKLLYKKYGEFNFKDKTSLAKLINDFREYYSPSLLKILQCDFGISSKWLIDIFILDGKIRNPLRHLLAINFFESTVEDFWNTSLEYNPFGTDYCPCVNRGSEYFQRLLIKDKCQHTDYSNSTKTVAEFRCICGCVSLKTDFNRINKHQVPIVTNKIKYGYPWEYALKMLWQNQEFSFTEIAQYLGVSEETIERQVGYLKLPLLRKMPNK
ncbi:MAG: TnsD family Tn7-like transposition protein [Nostoc sp. DedQUE08]|uniref:TnsD family Tn7-like transposition protein n=1 Tax=Nostoc sp. DedQUE08 TaxID=3075393 RepID=UPI002AD48CA4|nr:TnsD family Tn7-like transposition protein [Nostoc sp. DedQUE08]MDZ8070952.1 TnsD family Tn7-like transposition protein [Nostoc sp. DedQUE08]